MLAKYSILLRTVAVTLLIAMVYYFAGYRLVYSFIVHDAKEDAAFAMHHDGAITDLSLTAAQYANITWTEKGKEFSYNDQLFDVVGMQKVANGYQFRVYADKNETHWVKAMNDFVKFLFPGNHAKPNHAEGLVSAFQKEYTPLEKVQVAHIPQTTTLRYTEVQNVPVCLMIKPIWHPPASC